MLISLCPFAGQSHRGGRAEPTCSCSPITKNAEEILYTRKGNRVKPLMAVQGSAEIRPAISGRRNGGGCAVRLNGKWHPLLWHADGKVTGFYRALACVPAMRPKTEPDHNPVPPA